MEQIIGMLASFVWLIIGMITLGGMLIIYVTIKKIKKWFNHFKGAKNAINDLDIHVKGIFRIK